MPDQRSGYQFLEFVFSLWDEDQRMTHIHMALYLVLFRQWSRYKFSDSFLVSRSQLMDQARINSRTTFTRLMLDLQNWDYIEEYHPQHNPKLKSCIKLNSFREEFKYNLQEEIIPDNSDSSDLGIDSVTTDTCPKIEHLSEHLNGTCPNIGHLTEHLNDTCPNIGHLSEHLCDTCPKNGHLTGHLNNTCPKNEHLSEHLCDTCPKNGHLTGHLNNTCPKNEHLTGHLNDTCPKIEHLSENLNDTCPKIEHLSENLCDTCPKNGHLSEHLSEHLCDTCPKNGHLSEHLSEHLCDTCPKNGHLSEHLNGTCPKNGHLTGHLNDTCPKIEHLSEHLNEQTDGKSPQNEPLTDLLEKKLNEDELIHFKVDQEEALDLKKSKKFIYSNTSTSTSKSISNSISTREKNQNKSENEKQEKVEPSIHQASLWPQNHIFQPPALEEIILGFRQAGGDEDQARKFYKFYTDKDWCLSGGAKMTSVDKAIFGWIKRTAEYKKNSYQNHSKPTHHGPYHDPLNGKKDYSEPL